MATKMYPKVDVRKTKPKVCKQIGPNNVFWEPFGCHLGAKGCQKSTKMHPKIDVRKRSRKGCSKGDLPDYSPEHFGSHFPSKMHSKINTKVDVEKVWKFMRKCFKNDAKTRSKINDKSVNFWNLRFLVFSEEYNVKVVFSHDQGYQNSIEDP